MLVIILPSLIVILPQVHRQGQGSFDTIIKSTRTHSYFPKMRGPQYKPPNITVLTMGPPKKGTPNFGKPPLRAWDSGLRVTRDEARESSLGKQYGPQIWALRPLGGDARDPQGYI